MTSARAIVLCCMLAAGCRERAQSRPAGPPGSASPASPAGPASPAPAANQQPTDDGQRPVLTLPPRSGKPPVRTTARLAPAVLDRLSKLAFAGFTPDLRRLDDKVLEIKHHTEQRPKLTITVSAMACFDCTKMELGAWKARGEALKVLLAPELRNRPDTVFEVGSTEELHTTMVWTFQLGHSFGRDENGNPQGAYSDAYALYYNDGINQVRVVAEYADHPVRDIHALAQLVPKEDLAKIALAFMDAYVQAWGR